MAHIDLLVLFWNKEVPYVMYKSSQPQFKLCACLLCQTVRLNGVLGLTYAFTVVPYSARGIKSTHAFRSD